MRKLAFGWLDHVLKGAQMPEILQDRINYEVMGANRWKHVASLAAMHDHTLTLYLSGTRYGPGHLLEPDAPAHAGHLDQTVDFRDRTTQNNYFTPFILLKHLDSSHGLVFSTRPFAHPLVVSGSFSGTLRAAINKRDFDFSVAMYEQMPDGRYLYLAHALGRASLARDRGRREPLTPGARTDIPLGDTNWVSRRIGKGSRLVIVVNVNKNPYGEINYGTGGPVADESMQDAGQPLRVDWYTDSHITIPVMRTSADRLQGGAP